MLSATVKVLHLQNQENSKLAVAAAATNSTKCPSRFKWWKVNFATIKVFPMIVPTCRFSVYSQCTTLVWPRLLDNFSTAYETCRCEYSDT